MLQVIDLKSRRARGLRGTEGAELPFWSPDGRSLGFFAQGKLNVIELDTGRIRCLGPAPSPRGGAWGSGGVIVYAPSDRGSLYRVAAGGGAPSPLASLDQAAGETSHRWPQFLQGGRFLYSVLVRGSDEARIDMSSLDEAVPQSIFHAPGRVAYSSAAGGALIYSQHGRLLSVRFDPVRAQAVGSPQLVAPFVGFSWEYGIRLFSSGPDQVAFQGSDPDRVRALVWFDRDGRQGEMLGEPARYSLPEISPDGRQILVARSNAAGHSNIWLMDATTGAPRPLTNQNSYASNPVWSPDGKEFLFAIPQAYQSDIWRAALAMPESAAKVFDSDRYVFPMDWSGPKRTILFTRPEGDFEELWSFPVSGKKPSGVQTSDRYNIREGRVSPDGRWIASVSDETGAYNVYIAPFSGFKAGAQQRVSPAGGFDLRWNADGTELFYVDQLKQLIFVPIQMDGFRAGRPRVLFSLAGSQANPLEYEPGFGYSPQPGARRFLFNMRAAMPSRELTILGL